MSHLTFELADVIAIDMKFFQVFVSLFFFSAIAFAQNEIAPITEKVFDYKDWTYKSIETGKDVNLRKFVSGKRLVMVVYWAPWCHNWEYDVRYVQSIFEKYNGKGLDVIGVGMYDPVDSMRAHIKRFKLTFTNVFESTSTAERLTSLHYSQRREAGDVRKWGSPWYVFLEGDKLESEGQIILAKRPFVVNGELMRKETEAFIEQRLGLASSGPTAASAKPTKIEACSPEAKTFEFVKPCE